MSDHIFKMYFCGLPPEQKWTALEAYVVGKMQGHTNMPPCPADIQDCIFFALDQCEFEADGIMRNIAVGR